MIQKIEIKNSNTVYILYYDFKAIGGGQQAGYYVDRKNLDIWKIKITYVEERVTQKGKSYWVAFGVDSSQNKYKFKSFDVSFSKPNIGEYVLAIRDIKVNKMLASILDNDVDKLAQELENRLIDFYYPIYEDLRPNDRPANYKELIKNIIQNY